MKKTEKIAMLMALTLLSCNKIKETENKMEKEIEKNMIMNQINTVTNTDVTLLSGLNLDNSLFERNDIKLKKYKYDNIYIEDIKINDLLQEKYREQFFIYLENSVSGKEDNYESTLLLIY